MNARNSIENLWDRATPVGPLLNAYRAEVLHEAAEVGRELSRQGYSAQEIAKHLDRMADADARLDQLFKRLGLPAETDTTTT